MQKQTILEVVESLPQEVDLDELLSRLFVLQQIDEGERSLAEEGFIPHEEIKRRFGV